jgi:8-oxo-dGTP pyrophosphatase MutT (NUDIX family)
MKIRIYSEDVVRELDDNDELFKKYHPVTAAGGVVVNENNEVLLIFRRGKWDLPKGKVEDNEPLELCAEREVKEETGLKTLRLQRSLITTYHTYTDKGESVIKDTHWFLYKGNAKEKLEPQTEEDIMKIEWVAAGNLAKYTNNTYQLIREVLHTAGF